MYKVSILNDSVRSFDSLEDAVNHARKAFSYSITVEKARADLQLGRPHRFSYGFAWGEIYVCN